MAEGQPRCQRSRVLLQRVLVTRLGLVRLVQVPIGLGGLQPTGDRVGPVLVVGSSPGRRGVPGQYNLVLVFRNRLLVEVLHEDQRFPVGLELVDDHLGRQSGGGQSFQDPSLHGSIQPERLLPVIQSHFQVPGQPGLDSHRLVDPRFERPHRECLVKQMSAGGGIISVEVSQLSEVDVTHALQGTQGQRVTGVRQGLVEQATVVAENTRTTEPLIPFGS